MQFTEFLGADLFDQQLVKRLTQCRGKTHGLPRIDWLTGTSTHILHHPGEDHLPLHGGNGGGNIHVLPNGIKRAAQLFVKIQITQGYKARSEEHTSELQSLMRISYADLCLK